MRKSKINIHATNGDESHSFFNKRNATSANAP